MAYEILERDKQYYIGMVLLNEIINFQHYFSIKPVGEEVFLVEDLKFMFSKGLLEIKDGQYIPTDLGRQELVNLYAKYYDYLKMYDIYCAVDLEQGEFAFSSMNNDWTDEQWFNHLENERFSDVRVAVAEFKGLNPVEIVFLSFLNENRFDCTAPKWEDKLTAPEIWKEIEEICNTAISADYLKEDGVIEDVITQGTKIALELIKSAEEANIVPEEEVTEEIIEETTTEYVDVVEEPYYGYDYWDPYYDPYYVSPLWIVPIVLLY